jgi:hypothetical protein
MEDAVFGGMEIKIRLFLIRNETIPFLQAKVGNLEAEKNCLELKMQDMREEFTMRLATLEQKHQEEIAELKVTSKSKY